MPTAWINGDFVDEDVAMVSIRDTGLLHAAGVFTTLRAHNGVIFRLDAHLRRLRASCEVLFVPLQQKDEQLCDAAREILRRDNLKEARLRLTVTRGAARHDPLHGLRLQPTTFLTATQLEPYPQEFYARGMVVILLDEQKLNPYDLQAGHKTLNYFSRLAALREATRRGAGEALWFNVHNYLQSGCISNVFIVRGNTLITPPTPQEMLDAGLRETMPYPKSAVLPGITRAAILELAAEAGVQIQHAAISVDELLEADEVFLTNSVMHVMPVCRIERHTIGADEPGPITRKLTAALADRFEQECPETP